MTFVWVALLALAVSLIGGLFLPDPWWHIALLPGIAVGVCAFVRTVKAW